MSLTLTSDVNETATQLAITGTVPAAVDIGYRFKLSDSDEVMEVVGFGRTLPVRPWPVNKNVWAIHRGVLGTTATTHANGSTVKAIVDAFTASTTETPPDPVPAGGGVAVTGAQGGSVAAATSIELAGTVSEGSPGVATQSAVAELSDHGALLVDYTTPTQVDYAFRVHYQGAPTDYIPLVEIGDSAATPSSTEVYHIDSSGDADHHFRDSGISLKFWNDADGTGQVAKIGQSDVILGNAAGGFMQLVYGDQVYVQSAGAKVVFQINFASNGAVLMPNLPTADTGLVAGQLWCDTANGRVLKVSAG